MKKTIRWALPLAVAGALVVPASPVYAADDTVAQLKQTVKKLKQQKKSLTAQRDTLKRQNQTLSGQVTALRQELQAAKPAGQTGVRGDGTWRLNVDLAAGTWRTSGDGDGCYWERLSNLSGEFDAIIANDYFNGPAVVSIPSSDAAVSFSGGCVWTQV